MDSAEDIITGKKGQTVCRPSTWTDVVLFFAFNYGLHAFTILSPPGSTLFYDFSTALLSLLLPFSGILSALNIMFKCWLFDARGDLQVAHRAGALCMAIRRDQEPNIEFGFVVPPETNVHGQYPSTTSSVPGDKDESATPAMYQLVHVPSGFTITPLKNLGPTPFQLTYNYSILKGVAGIIQIVSGSFGLYEVSQHQFSRLGYGSYSLTIVPYILMSFVNLLATICEPQYPSMYLVIYRGLEPQTTPPIADSPPIPTTRPESPDDIASGRSEPAASPASPAAAFDSLEDQVIGAVGEAYGDLSQLADLSMPLPDARMRVVVLAVSIIGISCIAAPYIIIELLTDFQPGQTTQSQRGWLMAWLAIGQFYGGALFALRVNAGKGMNFGAPGIMLLVFGVAVGTAAIGGFVVVGKMIMNDEICTVL